MKVLFISPDHAPPWTEGRKRFVNDLAIALRSVDEVRIITTTIHSQSVYNKLHSVATMYAQLPRQLASFEPDAVFHFPYGIFRGIRGFLNRRFIRKVDSTCARAGFKCHTVLYSIDGLTQLNEIKRYANNIVMNPRPDWHGPTIALGISQHDTWTRRTFHIPPAMLFMAGMWQTTEERFNYVLDVRGLRVVLQAGSHLAPRGIVLHVAIPLLRDRIFQSKLLNHPDNKWPPESIVLHGLVDPMHIFRQMDIFIFPYQEDILQFVPTSIVEAMFFGTPVFMSDLPFLRRLVANEDIGYFFKHNDPTRLAQAILTAIHNSEAMKQRARNAYQYAINRWSISVSARQIRDLVRTS